MTPSPGRAVSSRRISARRGRIAAALLVTLAVAGWSAPAAGAQATWRLEQPAPPAGAPFKVPLGAPGDLQFYAPNRGLLGIEGNATIPRGIYTWDGVEWRQLATVCGGSGDTMRIAFAGPSEFWTVSEPSRPRFGSGLALCRFKDGQVAASYSTAPEAPDPFRQMNSATCNGPNDCWFGGVGSQDAAGERVGAFHLHWNGSTLETIYGPQGRGVSDVEAHGGTIYETTFVGRGPENRTDPVELAEPETPKPRLIHTIAGGAFANDPFEPSDRTGVPRDGTELLGLDSDGDQLWAVGGGAASGPSAPPEGVVARPPLAARLFGDAFEELTLFGATFTASQRFTDVAAVPGTSTAMATVVNHPERRSVNAKATVATIGPDGATTTTRLPVSGAGRGSAAKIACTGPNDCWMATSAGWLFHYTDGIPQPRDTNPAYANTITFRPNEAAEQFVPDRPPVDDSQLFAPPPLELDPTADPPSRRVRRLPPLIKKIKTRLRGLTLVVSFTVTRRARVALIAKKGRRTVARTRPRVLRPGRHSLSLRLSRRRYPTRLAFSTRALPKAQRGPAR